MEEFEGPPIPGSERDAKQKADRAMLNYIKNSLRATRPWTLLLSILGFLFVGFSILTGLALLFGRSLLPTPADAPPLILTGIINIAAGIMYLVPSIWLLKYSSSIGKFLRGGGAIELGNALAYQKSFWKFVGILTLISIIIAILGILAAIFIPTLLTFRI